MRNFKDKIQFIEAINKNDLHEIKHELVSMFFYLNGDENEINKTVDYAIANSSFKFENHVEEESEKNIVIDEKAFSIVSVNLTYNFSKQRLNKLMGIYNNVYKYQDVKSLNELYPKDENFSIKRFSIAAGALITLFILYKILT